MTWSYNPSLLQIGSPGTYSARDMVRLLIGDVVDCDQQMQDEEIEALSTLRCSVYGVAAECCRSLAARFSRSVDQSGGTNKILFSQMAKAYTIKCNEFEVKATFCSMPYSGGISVRDKDLQELMADRVTPEFVKGLTDNYLPVSVNSTAPNSILNRN